MLGYNIHEKCEWDIGLGGGVGEEGDGGMHYCNRRSWVYEKLVRTRSRRYRES